jgi:hypothetical protein
VKKFVAVSVVFVLLAGTVFAAPSQLAGSSTTVDADKANVALGVDDIDVFADVEAIALSDNETSEVEGAGFWGAIIVGVANAGAKIASIAQNGGSGNTGLDILGVVVAGGSGALIGYTTIPF